MPDGLRIVDAADLDNARLTAAFGVKLAPECRHGASPVL